jgi:hypothetical protein
VPKKPPPQPPPGWRGFALPRYTQTPDEVFDVWLAVLSGAELKVLLYIIRHTLGWHKDRDAISLAQLTDGIVKHDGERLDWGTGLGESTVLGAVKALLAYRLITAERSYRADGGDSPTVYSLYLAAEGYGNQRPRPQKLGTGVPSFTRPPSARSGDTRNIRYNKHRTGGEYP